MSLVRVIIATTQTPVSVLRITEEDPVVNSVVCLSGKAIPLPISGAYDAFVRDPTGVVQRYFQHSAFRIDVSDKIDEGYSWQLGLFTAHALQSAGRLAQQDAKCDRTVITTGEVDRDLNVLTVSGNAEKASVLRSQIEAFIDASHPVTLAVPKINIEEWHNAFSDLASASQNTFKILAIDTVKDLLDHLDVPLPGYSKQENQQVSDRPVSQKKSSWAAAALVFLIGAGAIASGSSYRSELEDLKNQFVRSTKDLFASTATEPPVAEPPSAVVVPPPAPVPVTVSATVPVTVSEKPATEARPEIPKPQKKPSPPPVPALPTTPVATPTAPPEKDILVATRLPRAIAAPLKIQISELRAPLGFSCEETRQMKIAPQTRPANLSNRISQYGKANDKLCTIEILATAAANDNYVFGRYQRWTQGRPRKSDPDKVIDLGPRKGPVSWSVDIPSKLPRPAVFQVLILSSNTVFEISRETANQLDKIRPGNDIMKTMQSRLQKAGVKLTTQRIRIIPDNTRTNGTQPRSATTASENTWQNTQPSPPPAR